MSAGRVSLADAYYHFVKTSPSERKAEIDLVKVLRDGDGLDLRAGKVIEYPCGTTLTKTFYDETSIPREALSDRQDLSFDWEHSLATWKKKAAR